jgi:hypothetical protein
MRLAARPSQPNADQRRELSRRKRMAAGSLSSAFPAVESVRIELNFQDESSQQPVRQLHALYPAAPAFFEFSCPHGDCDGSLEMNEIVSALLTSSAMGAEGTLRCPGFRAGPGMTKRPCSLDASYRIAAQYGAGEASGG